VNRGDVYDALLEPPEGSEQAGFRPVIVVSRDSLNAVLSTVVVVPCTTLRPGRPVYPTRALIDAPEAGLIADSIVLGEQVRVVAKSRLRRKRGTLSPLTMARIERALLIVLDLPGQS